MKYVNFQFISWIQAAQGSEQLHTQESFHQRWEGLQLCMVWHMVDIKFIFMNHEENEGPQTRIFKVHYIELLEEVPVLWKCLLFEWPVGSLGVVSIDLFDPIPHFKSESGIH